MKKKIFKNVCEFLVYLEEKRNSLHFLIIDAHIYFPFIRNKIRFWITLFDKFESREEIGFYIEYASDLIRYFLLFYREEKKSFYIRDVKKKNL